MKILLINKFYYKRGGSEAYLFALRKLLKDHGHQVIEFSMQDSRNEKSEYENYFIKNIDLQKREGFFRDLKKALHVLFSFEVKDKLEALIRAEKPDIAHIHNFNFQLTPSILFALKKHNIPIVWTMHDFKFICPNFLLFTEGAVCERCKFHKYYNCFLHNCFNSRPVSFIAMLEMYLHKIFLNSYGKISSFISPSKFQFNKIREWKASSNKNEQIYNFIDTAQFDPGYKTGKGLVYFGRFSREKGIMTLLQAIKELPEINLNILGTGPQESEINEFINREKLSNVKLSGYKSGAELYNLVKDARLVILPSICYENNPITILESFSLAKPVIASDLGGNSELISEGETGFLFKAGDAKALKEKIVSCYGDIQKLEKIGNNARKFVEKNFSQATHLNQILKVYNKLLSEK